MQFPLLMASMGVEAVAEFAKTGKKPEPTPGLQLLRHRRRADHRQAGRRRDVDHLQGRPRASAGADLADRVDRGRAAGDRRGRLATVAHLPRSAAMTERQRRRARPDAGIREAHSRQRDRARRVRGGAEPPLKRLQHFLHAYPTTVPFIVLLLGVALFSVDRRRPVLPPVQPVADPAAGHDHRHRRASRRP